MFSKCFLLSLAKSLKLNCIHSLNNGYELWFKWDSGDLLFSRCWTVISISCNSHPITSCGICWELQYSHTWKTADSQIWPDFDGNWPFNAGVPKHQAAEPAKFQKGSAPADTHTFPLALCPLGRFSGNMHWKKAPRLPGHGHPERNPARSWRGKGWEKVFYCFNG